MCQLTDIFSVGCHVHSWCKDISQGDLKGAVSQTCYRRDTFKESLPCIFTDATNAVLECST